MVNSDSSLGATVTPDGVRFAVWSGKATKIWVSLFNEAGTETHRVPLTRARDGVFSAQLPGLRDGQRYGLRADGNFDPHKGQWFDPDKLLVDPYAVEIDRAYTYDARLAAPRGQAGDTASSMPKSIVRALPEVTQKTPYFQPGGLIYELQVKAFTQLHPDIPEKLRGTVAALAHPAIIAHLKKLRVSAVELMPITAWMDERHLAPLGLTNAWGYNPVTFMALDPRLCPGGFAELRDTVAALHAEGIGVFLDLVFNHTAESDSRGPTLSFRGLDEPAYYRRNRGRLVNDTGTGNTIACNHPVVQRMVLDSLRHFIRHAGIDGFRFDLAPILGRDRSGFHPDAALLKAMREDPVIGKSILIAEPWDIGKNGYQLGNFGSPWLEWNDKFRDDVRKFWRGDRGMIGTLATRLAGSSDIFQKDGQATTRTVNFIAAHDGMTLADITAFVSKHNQANGEKNRDGHNDNLSWNNGVEGPTENANTNAARRRDQRALLATLFASRGAIMLTAGDEFGRTQRGNNNAYCQDNAIAWLNWQGRDRGLEDYASWLAGVRFLAPAARGRGGEGEAREGEGGIPILTQAAFLSGHGDVQWLTETGAPMDDAAWNDPNRSRLTMLLATPTGERLAVLINRDRRATVFELPARSGYRWTRANSNDEGRMTEGGSVDFMREVLA